MIRRANVDDLDQMELIEKQFGADAFTRRSLRHLISTDMCYVVDLGGRIAGYIIALKRSNSDKVRLYSLIVDEYFRGRGYGTELLVFFENQARLNGKNTIELEVRQSNKAAISMYYSFGFEISKVLDKYYPDGEDGLKFCKKI